MTITEKSFILVEEPTGIITVDAHLEELISGKIRPILWFNNGLFYVIPVEVLKNLLDQRDIYVAGGRKGKLELTIHWNQGYIVGDHAGLALSGLEH